MALRARPKNFVFITYNIFVVILCVTLIEWGLDYLLLHPKAIPDFLLNPYRKYYSRIQRSTIQMEPACARYDDGLFYTLKPGKCTFSNSEFSNVYNINSLGTRDDECALSKPEIVFLGDSFTMGWGVPGDSCFAGRLKKTTRQKILNAGISSYGTVRELKLLGRINRDSLRTVIIQYHSSDVDENKSFFNNHNELPISPQSDYENYSAKVRKESRYFPCKHTACIGKFLLSGIFEKERQHDRNEVKYFLNALEHAPVSLKGINIVVFETYSYNHRDPFLTLLRDEVESRPYPDYIKKIKIVNLGENLSDSDYFILDDHLNSSGHKKIADKLSQIIRPK